MHRIILKLYTYVHLQFVTSGISKTEVHGIFTFMLW